MAVTTPLSSWRYYRKKQTTMANIPERAIAVVAVIVVDVVVVVVVVNAVVVGGGGGAVVDHDEGHVAGYK